MERWIRNMKKKPWSRIRNCTKMARRMLSATSSCSGTGLRIPLFSRLWSSTAASLRCWMLQKCMGLARTKMSCSWAWFRVERHLIWSSSGLCYISLWFSLSISSWYTIPTTCRFLSSFWACSPVFHLWVSSMHSVNSERALSTSSSLMSGTIRNTVSASYSSHLLCGLSIKSSTSTSVIKRRKTDSKRLKTIHARKKSTGENKPNKIWRRDSKFWKTNSAKPWEAQFLQLLWASTHNTRASPSQEKKATCPKSWTTSKAINEARKADDLRLDYYLWKIYII